MGISVVTLQGMEAAYQSIYKTSIFDGISLPEAIDPQILYDRIMIRAGEFSVMYTDIDYLKYQTDNFFKVHYKTFEEWAKVMEVEYNPIENYDRYEDYSGNGSSSSESSATGSGTNSNTTTTTSAAENSSSYEPYDRVQDTGSTSSSGSSEGNESHRDSHTSHIHGNIGVTTSQQMIQSSIDLYKNFNIYDWIADMYTDDICIKIY